MVKKKIRFGQGFPKTGKARKKSYYARHDAQDKNPENSQLDTGHIKLSGN